MRHKTAELEGALLDAAVAKAEGRPFAIESHLTLPPKPVACWLRGEDGKALFTHGLWSPSTRWDQAGPIIDAWRLDVLKIERMDAGGWEVTALARTGESVYMEGPTHLVALMRAYVAHRLGEEVELP
jgi:hypothetical protein